VLGAAVALGSGLTHNLATLCILVAANVCLLGHVFALNDWSNLTADLRDPNKSAHVFTARGVTPWEMGALTIALLFMSLVIVALLGPGPLSIALGIAVLSALYSLPPFAWKGRPLLNSFAHVAGGSLHFLLGYSIALPVDGRGLAVALFFGTTFTAGHLMQELRDYQGDVRNGVRTNAVMFGRHRTFTASLALFTLAQALLLALAVRATIPHVLVWVSVLYPIHLWWSLQTYAAGITYASVTRLQMRYRALYAAIGVAWVVAMWLA
jgi:4-hydroxybenzoate polyprenyltransferase